MEEAWQMITQCQGLSYTIDLGRIGFVMLQMNLDLASPPTMELCDISQRLTSRQFHVI